MARPINNGLTWLIGLLRGLKLFCFAGVHKFSKNLEATPKFEDARWVTISKSCTEDLKTLSATAANLVARTAWCLGFVHPTQTWKVTQSIIVSAL